MDKERSEIHEDSNISENEAEEQNVKDEQKIKQFKEEIKTMIQAIYTQAMKYYQNDQELKNQSYQFKKYASLQYNQEQNARKQKEIKKTAESSKNELILLRDNIIKMIDLQNRQSKQRRSKIKEIVDSLKDKSFMMVQSSEISRVNTQIIKLNQKIKDHSSIISSQDRKIIELEQQLRQKQRKNKDLHILVQSAKTNLVYYYQQKIRSFIQQQKEIKEKLITEVKKFENYKSQMKRQKHQVQESFNLQVQELNKKQIINESEKILQMQKKIQAKYREKISSYGNKLNQKHIQFLKYSTQMNSKLDEIKYKASENLQSLQTKYKEKLRILKQETRKELTQKQNEIINLKISFRSKIQQIEYNYQQQQRLNLTQSTQLALFATKIQQQNNKNQELISMINQSKQVLQRLYREDNLVELSKKIEVSYKFQNDKCRQHKKDKQNIQRMMQQQMKKYQTVQKWIESTITPNLLSQTKINTIIKSQIVDSKIWQEFIVAIEKNNTLFHNMISTHSRITAELNNKIDQANSKLKLKQIQIKCLQQAKDKAILEREKKNSELELQKDRTRQQRFNISIEKQKLQAQSKIRQQYHTKFTQIIENHLRTIQILHTKLIEFEVQLKQSSNQQKTLNLQIQKKDEQIIQLKQNITRDQTKKEQLQRNYARLSTQKKQIQNDHQKNQQISKTFSKSLSALLNQKFPQLNFELPQSNQFEQIYNFIEKNVVSSSDTALSVSSILQKRLDQRNFLIKVCQQFLTIKKFSSTLLFSYNQFCRNFQPYFSVKQLFTYVVLFESLKGEVFGVIARGVGRGSIAHAFNLNQRALFIPSDPESVTFFAVKIEAGDLCFGKNEIKIRSNQNTLEVQLTCINFGTRYFEFGRSDICGKNESSDMIKLKRFEIHRIELE